jgi:hypothetical protein
MSTLQQATGRLMLFRRVAARSPKSLLLLHSRFSTSKGPRPSSGNRHLAIRAGLPFVLFSILASWVVGQALNGKLKEMETSQGKVSKSLRQAAVEQEHDEMMDRLNKIVANDDFDNTKRILRPEEILEQRRKARERKNAWHRRTYRWIFRIAPEEDL